MPVYDPAAVAAYVYAAVVNAGGSISDADLTKAVAIAGRESSWDSGALNDNASTKDLSGGWFQANFFDDPNRFADIGISGIDALRANPWNSAKAFAKLFMSSGFYAWGPYKGQNELTGVKPETISAAQKGVANARRAGLLTPEAAKRVAGDNGPFGATVGSGGGGGGGGGTGGNGLILDALTAVGITAIVNAGADVGAGAASAAADAARAIASPFSSIGDLVSALGNTLFNPEWWRWIGIGAIGVGLIVAAIVYTNRDQIATAGKVAAIA